MTGQSPRPRELDAVRVMLDRYVEATRPGTKGATPIRLMPISTPLGILLAGATERGLCLLTSVDLPTLPSQVERVRRRHGAALSMGESPVTRMLEQQLDAYFDRRLEDFDLPLDVRGTPFQQSAWAALQRIPYGSTLSYGEQAARMGRPSSVRAVARANGDNPISIVVPCHRVLGKDGKLTGYAGGLWRKKHLLELEGILLL